MSSIHVGIATYYDTEKREEKHVEINAYQIWCPVHLPLCKHANQC